MLKNDRKKQFISQTLSCRLTLVQHDRAVGVFVAKKALKKYTLNDNIYVLLFCIYHIIQSYLGSRVGLFDGQVLGPGPYV